jgi:preprotein translocase subunit SecF
VVFDKVRENVRDIKSSTTKTYSEAANLAVNQVLVRSINTTIIGVLPVAALLFAGAVILGEGPLKDLSLALFVGMVSGAYSSIFIATPLLAQMMEREPDMKKLATRVANRRAKELARTGGRGADSAAEPADSELSDLERPDPEPTNAELAADDDSRAPTAPRITLASASGPAPVRPVNENHAKRPQPEHKPRSQRRK